MANDGDVSSDASRPGLATPLSGAFGREEDWPVGVRAALAALLEFFDSEPQLARAWLLSLLSPLRGLVVGSSPDPEQVAAEAELSDVVELPAMLRNAKAKRARMCVLYLAEQGGRGSSPSNRQIAAAVGIAHKGQVSKLLTRLEGAGILSKISHGAGRPNAWELTPYGREIAVHFELRENT